MKGKVGETRATVLSDLPEAVLHHILSRLPFKDSVRTSVLSKQWNSARKSYPFLDFKQPENMYDMDFEQPEFKKRLREFLSFVDRSLQYVDQNKLGVERMRLHVFGVDQKSVPLINTWLPLALRNGVSEVQFRAHVFVGKELNYPVPLPESTFAVNSSLSCDSFKFFCLKRLTLDLVSISVNIVRDIIRNCPNISHLSLRGICGLDTLNISELNKLVSLKVDATSHGEIKSVYVNALSLKKFCSRYCGDIDLTSCCNLKEIYLYNSKITDAQFPHHISKFPHLEVLTIAKCHGLQRIKISLQRLKFLQIYLCNGVKAIEIDAPILSSLEFLPASNNVLISVSSMAIRCSVQYPQRSWSLKLRECLGVPFKGVNISRMNLSIKFTFGPDISRELVSPSFIKVDVIDLTGLRIVGSFHWVTLLDTLLLTCHPKIVSMTVDSSDEDNCVNIFRKMLVQSECQLCCNSARCKCWHRRLKSAKIKSINGDKLKIGNICEIDHMQFLRVLDTFLSIPIHSQVQFKLKWDHSDYITCPVESLTRFSISSE